MRSGAPTSAASRPWHHGFEDQPLLAERRALVVRFASEERLIAAEDAGRYRDALGVMPPGGLPETFLVGGPESLEQLVLRFARGRGPFTTAEADARFGIDVEPVLSALERRDKLVRGELRPGGTEREWCEPDLLRRLRPLAQTTVDAYLARAMEQRMGRELGAHYDRLMEHLGEHTEAS